MATITEDYVSFETAKLLKEKGFNGLCNAYYDCFTTDNFHSGCEPTDFNSIDTRIRNIVSAPTLQMAMKWLREIHDRNIIFNMIPKDNDCYVLWTFNILANKNNKIIWGTKQPKHKTYEEACEAAIKYCLENLI